MGKLKRKVPERNGSPGQIESAAPPSLLTTSAIAKDADLGYKMRLLIYDLRNLTRESASERRLNSTTDERYIGLPYFTAAESAIVKAARVDVKLDPAAYLDLQDYILQSNEEDALNDSVRGLKPESKANPSPYMNQSFETVLGLLLGRFLDKRKASGDARPCGPHHLAPLYAAIFNIKLVELQDATFISRARRQRLDF